MGEAGLPNARLAVQLDDLGREPAQLFPSVRRCGQDPDGVLQEEVAQALELAPDVDAARRRLVRHPVNEHHPRSQGVVSSGRLESFVLDVAAKPTKLRCWLA